MGAGAGGLLDFFHRKGSRKAIRASSALTTLTSRRRPIRKLEKQSSRSSLQRPGVLENQAGAGRAVNTVAVPHSPLCTRGRSGLSDHGLSLSVTLFTGRRATNIFPRQNPTPEQSCRGRANLRQEDAHLRCSRSRQRARLDRHRQLPLCFPPDLLLWALWTPCVPKCCPQSCTHCPRVSEVTGWPPHTPLAEGALSVTVVGCCWA